ncbi:hypothetical protein HAX54_051232 [Datura stramonium]|uniref:Uncharacterized protein n=1 Tax=Datura stramonium TaxID=4076 RepID=A0ABS8WPV4_DATST|nr:hypothetical protein [Datura stramonium]
MFGKKQKPQLWYVQYPNEGPWYELLVIPFGLSLFHHDSHFNKGIIGSCKKLICQTIDWDNEMEDPETEWRWFKGSRTASSCCLWFSRCYSVSYHHGNSNTVFPVQSKAGAISYKAQSQDEEALVRAAARLNMVFLEKKGNILDINFNGSLVQYEVLDT